MPVLVAFGSFLTTLLGGWAALRAGDRRHLVLGVAAGLMLGVVFFDLVPEALAEQPSHVFGVPIALIAVVAGFLALHVVERAAGIHRAHEGEYAGHSHQQGVGLVAPRAASSGTACWMASPSARRSRRAARSVPWSPSQ
jgi:hypothetical protein